MSDILNELNAQLGLGGKKMYLPAELERRGYKALKIIGEGAYGQALLVNTRGNLPAGGGGGAKRTPSPAKGGGNDELAANRQRSSSQQWDITSKDPYSLPELIIVKHISLGNFTRAERAAARNEIGFLKKLNHPNIVRYIDSYEEVRPVAAPSAAGGAKGLVGAGVRGPSPAKSVNGDHVWISMEYADGGDLDRLMKKGGGTVKGVYKRIDEKDILGLFCQIVSAVGYMHSLKVLHRDLKPQNVFLTNATSPSEGTMPNVKIGDFGISKSLDHTKAMANTVCGTPYYFSPELCKGRPYNAASDVWALGVMLFEMLTRRMPFDAKNMPQLMAAICNSSPTRRPEFNENTWALVSSMLSKDPLKRPDCSSILLHPALNGIATQQQQMSANTSGPLPSHMLTPRQPSIDLSNGGSGCVSPTAGGVSRVPLPLGQTPLASNNPSANATPAHSRSPSVGAPNSNNNNGAPQPRDKAYAPTPTPYSNQQPQAVLPKYLQAGGGGGNNGGGGLHRAVSDLGPVHRGGLLGDYINVPQQGGGVPFLGGGGQNNRGSPSKAAGANQQQQQALRPHNFMPLPAGGVNDTPNKVNFKDGVGASSPSSGVHTPQAPSGARGSEGDGRHQRPSPLQGASPNPGNNHPLSEIPPSSSPTAPRRRRHSANDIVSASNDSDNSSNCSSKETALRMQEAALIRARIAAKYEAYANEQVWRGPRH